MIGSVAFSPRSPGIFSGRCYGNPQVTGDLPKTRGPQPAGGRPVVVPLAGRTLGMQTGRATIVDGAGEPAVGVDLVRSAAGRRVASESGADSPPGRPCRVSRARRVSRAAVLGVAAKLSGTAT